MLTREQFMAFLGREIRREQEQDAKAGRAPKSRDEVSTWVMQAVRCIYPQEYQKYVLRKDH